MEPIEFKKLRKMWFKNTFERKHNRYIFVTICDKNGNCLRNIMPNIPEFNEIIADQIWQHSDVVSHENWLQSGITKITTKKFIKMVAPNMLQSVFGEANESGRLAKKVERSRVPGKNLYMFQNIEDLLYREETFFKGGVVWVFGNLDFLSDLRTVIDEIRICSCNVDFSQMFDEQIDFISIYDLLKKFNFNKVTEMVTKEVKKNLELIANNRRPKAELIETRVLDNGMKYIDTSKTKISNIPTGLYDYKIEYWLH